jgi:hypothetical protein
MPEVPEEEYTPPPKKCRFRMNNAFMYYCTECGATQKELDKGTKKCPIKPVIPNPFG